MMPSETRFSPFGDAGKRDAALRVANEHVGKGERRRSSAKNPLHDLLLMFQDRREGDWPNWTGFGLANCCCVLCACYGLAWRIVSCKQVDKLGLMLAKLGKESRIGLSPTASDPERSWSRGVIRRAGDQSGGKIAGEGAIDVPDVRGDQADHGGASAYLRR